MHSIRELEGKISVKFFSHFNIEQICLKHIPGFDPDRFSIVAVRIFSGEEYVLTVYAADKHNDTIHQGKTRVKKFKIQSLLPQEFFNYLESYNFTLVNSHYNIADMEVINK